MKLSELVADGMRLPKDVVLDLPRISICGDKEIYIENHKGLSEYSDTDIRVKMNDGIIHMNGENLRIIIMENNRMVVNGTLKYVDYE